MAGGRLTDGQGRTVNFKNTVILMTSNLGTEALRGGGRSGESAVLEAVRGRFRPEFINRIDEIVVFERLGDQALESIVDIQLERVRRRLQEKSIRIDVGDAAKTFLSREGCDPAYGARPLKRAIQRHLVDALAKRIIAGEFSPGDRVEVELDKSKKRLAFTKAAKEVEPEPA